MLKYDCIALPCATWGGEMVLQISIRKSCRDNDYNKLQEKQRKDMAKDNRAASGYRVLMLVNVLLKFVFLSLIQFSVRKE